MTIPDWIKSFSHPGYINVFSIPELANESKLYCTETLLGDWSGETLILAKDAAPAHVILDRIKSGEPDPWRHGVRGRDPMGFQTNERVKELADLIKGGKLYGSALAHLLKEDERTSSSLSDFHTGPLREHLECVLGLVVKTMPKLRAVICLGNEAHDLVSSIAAGAAAGLQVGQCSNSTLFERELVIARLYHPSRAFKGGLGARRKEWNDVAEQINKFIANDAG